MLKSHRPESGELLGLCQFQADLDDSLEVGIVVLCAPDDLSHVLVVRQGLEDKEACRGGIVTARLRLRQILGQLLHTAAWP